jgi:hypothetical protein
MEQIPKCILKKICDNLDIVSRVKLSKTSKEIHRKVKLTKKDMSIIMKTLNKNFLKENCDLCLPNKCSNIKKRKCYVCKKMACNAKILKFLFEKNPINIINSLNITHTKKDTHFNDSNNDNINNINNINNNVNYNIDDETRLRNALFDRESYYDFNREEYRALSKKDKCMGIICKEQYYDTNKGKIYNNYKEPENVYICEFCVYSPDNRDREDQEDIIICRRCLGCNIEMYTRNCDSCENLVTGNPDNIVSKYISCYGSHNDKCEFSVNIFVNKSKGIYYAYHDTQKLCIYH